MSEQTKEHANANQHTILFVCFGNVHRSVLAEEVANIILRQNQLDGSYRAISRGVQGSLGFEKPKHSSLMEYDTEWELTKRALAVLHVDTRFFLDRKSTPIDIKTIQQATEVVTMDQKIYEILTEHFPDQANKLVLFSAWVDTSNPDDIMDCCDEEKHLAVNTSIVKGIQSNLITKLKIIE